MGRSGKILLHDSHIGLWEDDVDEEGLHRVYGAIIRHLRGRGFKIYRCQETKKNFPTLSYRHHRGHKGPLWLKMDYCGRHLEMNFFQKINVVNRNGGEYDFDRFIKMPYLVKKQFILESSKVIDMLTGAYGYGFSGNMTIAQENAKTVVRVMAAIQGVNESLFPLERFNRMWGADRFERDPSGWPTVHAFDWGGHNKDRDGVPLRNGMVRYLRGRDGRLKRGVIYTNMNEMWQVVCGPGRRDSHYVSGRELFSLRPEDCRGRWFSMAYRRKKMADAFDRSVKLMNFERAAVLRDVLGLTSRAA